MTYSYDKLNRLETVVDPQTGTTRYSYDTVGSLKTVSYPNGTVATYEYDMLNRLTLLENRGRDGSLISSYAYTLDASGNRTKVEEEPSGRVVDYVYDSTNRLLSESITEPGKENRVLSYSYDKVGNRLTKTENGFTTTYVYDDNNRLIKEDDVTYSYDDNGNLIEKESAEEQIVYQYDYDNHLTRVETSRYNATIVVEYEYDAEGNRVRKTIDGNIVINYLVDTNREYAQVVEERDGDGTLLVRYVYGHDLISQTRPSAGSGSVTSYYHYDGLGSTRELSSSAGIVTDSYQYDAFGLLLEQTGTTENVYRYRGEQFDEELGFYYLRARYMDSNVGRFVTMDEFAGSSQDPVTLHKYLYANANPITYSDPSGYFSLAETQVGNAIQNVLQRHNSLMKIAKYRYMVGALTGAVENIVDSRLGGKTWGETLISGAVGGVTGVVSVAVGGAAGTAIGKTKIFLKQFPRLFCKVKALAPILLKTHILRGAWGGLKGIKESIDNGEYDQAAWRSALLIWSIVDMRRAWKTSACFTEETLIAVKGGYKRIKDIEVGDEVYATDIESGEKGLKPVKSTFIREISTLVYLTVDDLVIETTSEHPFWVQGEGWVSAKQLDLGDELRLYSGEIKKIIATRHEILTEPITVYNIEVEEWHTYYVSSQKILVHNADNCKPRKVPKPKISGKEGAKDVPSWVLETGERPFVGEAGKKFARRLLEAKYPGVKDFDTGGKSEFSRIKKWADRNFMNPSK